MTEKQTDMKKEYEDRKHRQAQEIQTKQEYQQYVEQITPKKNIWWQMLKAFVVMDISYICADIGQDVRRKKCRKHIVYEGICPFDTHPPDTIADGVGIFP